MYDTDEVERITCPHIRDEGHRQCGWCHECAAPRLQCVNQAMHIAHPFTYETLIDLIGPGFHPDTRGADYTSLPKGVTPDLVDDVVSLMFVKGDAYQIAFERFIRNGWVKISSE